MSATKIYLAGPMDAVTLEISKNWRVECHRLFENEIRDSKVELLDPTRRPHESDMTFAEVFRQDLTDVRKCDIVLADIRWMPRENTGTSCEMFYASEVLGKAVIGWLDDEHKPPHIRVFMSQIVIHEFDSLLKSVDHIKAFYI